MKTTKKRILAHRELNPGLLGERPGILAIRPRGIFIERACLYQPNSFCLISIVFYTCICENQKPRVFLPILAYGNLKYSKKRQKAT